MNKPAFNLQAALQRVQKSQRVTSAFTMPPDSDFSHPKLAEMVKAFKESYSQHFEITGLGTDGYDMGNPGVEISFLPHNTSSVGYQIPALNSADLTALTKYVSYVEKELQSSDVEVELTSDEDKSFTLLILLGESNPE